MKRCLEARAIPFAAIVAIAVAGFGAVAQAQPAQEFQMQVATPHPGDVRVRVTVRSFDTTGAVPLTPTELAIRLPRGFALDRPLLDARWLCDGRALRAALEAHPTGQPFTDRLKDLRPLMRTLARSRSKRARAALAAARACERGRLGGGVGVIDARRALPTLGDPIPFVFSMFLSRGAVPGAIAGLTSIGAADPRSAVVRAFPVVGGVYAVLTESFVADPTPDGLYGVKLIHPTGPINGFQLSLAEVHARLRSLQARKGTCARADRRGRCVRRLHADASLFQLPPCPASGLLSAELVETFPPPSPTLTTPVQQACPRFVR
jgi:hypothetical protein